MITLETVQPRFIVGQILSDAYASYLLGPMQPGGGWFRDDKGREIYMCDGSHKDGTRGFRICQIGRY